MQDNISGYEFGPFTLDVQRRLLFRDGSIIAVLPKVLDLIACLVDLDGNVVTREDLETRVWDGSPVSDTNIARHVHLARSVLDDRRKPYRYIRTVTAKGYRFGVTTRVLYKTEAERTDVPERRAKQFLVSEFVGNAIYFERLGTARALESSLACLQRAISIDSSYAQASARAAWVHLLRAFYSYDLPKQCFERAREHALHAFRLDAACRDAHIAMAALCLYDNHDSDAAMVELEKAESIGPASPRAYFLKTQIQIAAQNYASACESANQSLLRFPGSRTASLAAAFAEYYSGQIDAAAERLQRILALHPASGFAHLLLGLAEIARGQYSVAQARLKGLLLAKISDVAAYDKYRDRAIAALAYIEARNGNREGARSLMDDLTRRSRSSYSGVALIAMGLGISDEMQNALQRAFDLREPWAMFFRSDPLYNHWKAGVLLRTAMPAERNTA